MLLDLLFKSWFHSLQVHMWGLKEFQLPNFSQLGHALGLVGPAFQLHLLDLSWIFLKGSLPLCHVSLSGTVSHSCRGSTWHSLLSQAWGMTAASTLSFQTSRMKSGLFSMLSAPPGLFSAVLRNSFLKLPELKRLTLALWPYIQPLLWGSC